MKTAIVLGATGLTGSILLENLLNDSNYKKIKIFTRRSVNIQSPKIEEYIVDLLKLEAEKENFTANEVFCCIGTTTKKTKDKSVYKAIDFGIPSMAAKLSKENKCKTFVVMSSMGANANSSIFYNRIKGEMEQAVLSNNIENTYVFRPSLINGTRSEGRFGEDIGNFIAKIINPLLIGGLKKYRSIKAETIAKAMQKIVVEQPNQKIISSDLIQHIADKY